MSFFSLFLLFRCTLVVGSLLLVMLIEGAVGGDEHETIRSRIQVRKCDRN